MPFNSFPLLIFIALPAYVIACMGAGFLFISILARTFSPMSRQSSIAKLVTSFALGQGLLASIWLLLALGMLFSRTFILLILVISGLLGLELFRREIPGLSRQLVATWHNFRNDTWGWQGLAAMAVMLCLAWITSIGRPLNVDGASLYLAFPKVIAASHRLIPLPGYETFADVGLQGELHYAVFMSFHVPDAARLFAWPTFLAGALILVMISRQVGLGPRGQWLTLAILASSSAVIYLSFDGKVDMFAVPLGLSAYYWMLQIRGEEKQLALWLTGLFGGFACVAKISYLTILPPSLVFLLVWQLYPDLRDPVSRKQALKTISLNGLQILVGVLVAILPHLIKNYLLYDNPISPFGTGPSWATQPWYGPSIIRKIILTYPLAMTYGKYFAQYGNLSPLWVAFLPLAFLLPRPRPFFSSRLAGVTLAAVFGMTVWTIVNPSNLAPRYYLAPLLLFILLSARAAEYVSYSDRPPRWLLFGILSSVYVVISVTGLYFATETFFPARTHDYLAGDLDECQRDSSDYCEGMWVINKMAHQGERVFLADWLRYWLRPDLLQCLSYTKEMAEFNELKTPDEKWQYVYEHGFTYMFIDKMTHTFVYDALIQQPPEWVRLKLLYSNANGSIFAYKLNYINPPGTARYSCNQLKPPAWDVVEK